MWEYNYSIPNDELYHYGVKGMKWGVRRYQNPDGTLTSAGKKHYGNSNANTSANIGTSINETKKQNYDKIKSGAKKVGAAVLGTMTVAKATHAAGKAIKNKYVKDLAIEKAEFKALKNSAKTAVKSTVKDIALNPIGTMVEVAVVGAYAYSQLPKDSVVRVKGDKAIDSAKNTVNSVTNSVKSTVNSAKNSYKKRTTLSTRR